MKSIRFTLVAICSLLLLTGVSYAQSIEAFVIVRDDCIADNGATDGTLHRLNPVNADTTAIGPIGFPGGTGLEFLSDGRLVGSASDDGPDQDPRRAVLIDINKETGAGTLIGEIGNSDTGCGRAPDLSLDSNTDTLFATGDACGGTDFLQGVNQETGSGTLIGTYNPFNGGGNGIAVRDDGVIFVSASEALITVDPLTGAPTEIADIEIVDDNDGNVFVNALAFHPVTGELYGTTIDQTGNETNKESVLVIINTLTGATEIVGQLPDCTDGLVFGDALPRPIPTLSEWGLIAMAGALGIIGIIAVSRRKAAA